MQRNLTTEDMQLGGGASQRGPQCPQGFSEGGAYEQEWCQ